MAKPAPELLDRTRYPVCYTISTRFQDVDPNEHVNNVAMTIYFEDARVRLDKSLQEHRKHNERQVRTMIASLNVEFLAEAFYPDPIDVHIGILDVGRSSWTFGAIACQGDTVAAFSRAVIVNLEDGLPAPLPASFRAHLEDHRIAMEGAAQ